MILTEQQRAVVDAEGDFLLLACPGSGKTRSAAERTARLTRTPGAKVAVCSYTNVGADRIGTVLAAELGVALDQKHFLGTIHKFLLRYVVHPYAHLLGAERGPFIHEGGGWPEVRVYGDNTQRIGLDRFRCTADGSLTVTRAPRGVRGTSEEIVAAVGREVRQRKGGLFRRAGLLTADDAMWIALRLLREFSPVAQAVAGRFDELLLDEAQDTSELQLACLEVLHATGALRSLVLVGDLEQSIFSFQGASAERCQKLADDRGLRVLSLTENHRSSQRICDAAVNFCTRTTPDTAVGPHAGCEISPEVMLYPAKEPQAALAVFRARLARYEMTPEQATVLARNWKIVDALNGQTSLFKDTERQYVLGRLAARLAAGTLTAHDVRRAQRLLAYCAWDTTHVDTLTDEQRAALRRAGHLLLGRLPALGGDLRTWLVSAREALHAVASTLEAKVAHVGGRAVTTKPDWANEKANDVFAPAPRELSARTVHSFKGEDSDAVMVVIRRPHGSDPTSQMELWEAAVAGTEIDAEKAEERRVLFVALTRARRYCLVALPDDGRGRSVAASCTSLGFQVITTT
ncbi:UvrD-helicase domain-containing protein [Patulibacter medicamentivorans]|uniref:UvrD-helicase domain-containing protein n=1 Tax=Patulibacter medicamentivorans TaxID=1097667 RepID=UPI00058D8FDE|nr:ATP-dependent helicase [Patulibacter medicamentivorans]